MFRRLTYSASKFQVRSTVSKASSAVEAAINQAVPKPAEIGKNNGKTEISKTSNNEIRKNDVNVKKEEECEDAGTWTQRFFLPDSADANLKDLVLVSNALQGGRDFVSMVNEFMQFTKKTLEQQPDKGCSNLEVEKIEVSLPLTGLKGLCVRVSADDTSVKFTGGEQVVSKTTGPGRCETTTMDGQLVVRLYGNQQTKLKVEFENSLHDLLFSSRSIPDVVRIVDHHKYSLAWLPTGDQWRRLRRITREYFFSGQRLEASELARGQKVEELIDYVDKCCTNEKAVNIGAAAFTTNLNTLLKLMFSVDFGQHDSVSSQEFKEAVKALLEIAGTPNLADFFPVLKSLDPQGLVRRGNVYGEKLLTIIDRIIDQRLHSRLNSSSRDGVSSINNDVLDSLLDLVDQESMFSREDMKHLFYVLFIAGTDTTSSTLEWAMTELIRNPKKMETARAEINKSIQNNKGIVQETHISQLPYLQAVIKETLRLHPPIPLLLPHQAIQDVQVHGFIVPKNAQILCNVWAMGRDPNIWLDPETFMPERFFEVKVDYKGQDYEFIPFGAGRRICPGLNIAHRMLHRMLGSLIHKFDWKLEGNIRAEDMDMNEKFGLTLPRKIPLMAIPVKL